VGLPVTEVAEILVSYGIILPRKPWAPFRVRPNTLPAYAGAESGDDHLRL